MNFFKNQPLLYKLFAVYLILIFIYFQLMMRKEKITLSVFKDGSLDRVLPLRVQSLRKIKDRLLLAAALLLCFSAAGPQWGREFVKSEGFSGNIAIAVDTSLSMSAEDIKPSRLESAKLAIKYLFKDLSDYKFAIFAFQGKPYIQCPMTSDYDALMYFAESMHPNMLPSKGTNIPAVIKLAASYLSRYEGEKMLVLITDGEDHHEDEMKYALDLAQKASLKIMTVSIGTTEGDLIKDPQSGEYKKDLNGNTVLSRVNENILIEIAGKTHGKYIKYTNPENVSEEIRSFAETLKKAKTSSINSEIYKNRFQIPLIFALLLIMIEFIIMEEKTYISILPGKKMMIIPFLIFLAGNIFAKGSSYEAAQGNTMYNKGDFSKAYDYYQNAYKKKQDDRILFNMGNALYKMEEYSKAADAFESIKDPKIKSKAFYNAGNARYLSQDKESAIKDYRKALLINPKDKRALYNLQVALENKTSPQSQNKEDKQNKKQNENDKEQKDKNQDENKNNNDKQSPEKKRAQQLLDMMKEREKENRKKADRRQAQPQKSDDYEAKDW